MRRSPVALGGAIPGPLAWPSGRGLVPARGYEPGLLASWRGQKCPSRSRQAVTRLGRRGLSQCTDLARGDALEPRLRPLYGGRLGALPTRVADPGLRRRVEPRRKGLWARILATWRMTRQP